MELSPKETVIGFVGTGVMGKSMAKNLLKAGYRLNVYNRTKESAQELVQLGAVWKDTVAELAEASQVVISMVGYPKDVEKVYLGEGGLIAHAKAGSYLIDMTTSSPVLAKTLAAEGEKKGIHVLDAPVSGGDIGARDGKLVIMVGGQEKDFNAVIPVFEAMGTNIILQGPAGSGQYTKMCNQITIASNMIGVAEAMAYAQKSGLDPIRVLDSIGGGAAGSWSLSNLGPRMIKGDYAPGFYVKHIIKDIKIAIDSAQEMGLRTPGLELAKSLYEKLAAEGEENSGTQALIKLYQ
ncbi:NAD(P)-dependent oxidoreductase [Desulfitobacterium sp.]|uniref:NAD(P)-dependent oxidoreductase n=1 Tax=Desulfitobacterium sp. TaxID=49981 RepID=UPI002B20E1D2|nr:NAD(P)-dependent oxidoreductase [Desulfitobacterium sp.]MEA4901759.1 NAD(P)-dependent oxidoreductase [Desulfitobacterium sp.]